MNNYVDNIIFWPSEQFWFLSYFNIFYNKVSENFLYLNVNLFVKSIHTISLFASLIIL